MSRSERGLKYAHLRALTSQSKYRVGAVLMTGSILMKSACNNMVRSHPLYYPANLHAELAVILKAGIEGGIPFKHFTLYIVRLDKAGNRKLAKPCPRCQALIEQVGIKKVVHS